MAKYTITYACGHTATEQLYGKQSNRDYAIASALHHDCLDCRAKAAKEYNEKTILPTLTGSDKQIIWALDCRSKTLLRLDAYADKTYSVIERIDAGEANGKHTPEIIAAERAKLMTCLDKIKSIRANTSAHFWIETRTDDPRALIHNAKI